MSVKWGDIPKLIRGDIYSDSALGEGLLGLAHETSGIMPNHGKCVVASLWPLP